MAANLADLFIRLGIKDEGFQKGIKGWSADIKGTGKSIASLGKDLTHGLTIPLGAFAAAAAASSSEFRTQFEGVKNIAGEVLDELVKGFSDLPAPIQKGIATVAGLTLAMGPLVQVSGSLIKAFATIGPLAVAIGEGLGGPLGLVTVAATGAAIAFAAFAAASGSGARGARGLAEDSETAEERLERLRKKAKEAEAEALQIRRRQRLAEQAFQQQPGEAQRIAGQASGADAQLLATAAAEKFGDAGLVIKKYNEDLLRLTTIEGVVGQTEESLSAKAELTKKAYEDVAAILGPAADDYSNLGDVLTIFRKKQDDLAERKTLIKKFQEEIAATGDYEKKIAGLTAQEELFGQTEETISQKIAAVTAELKRKSEQAATAGSITEIADATEQAETLSATLDELKRKQEEYNNSSAKLWEEWGEETARTMRKLNRLGIDTWTSIRDGFAQAIGELLILGGSFRDKMGEVFNQVASQAIATVIAATLQIVAAKITEIIFQTVASYSSLPFGIGIAIGLAQAGVAILAAKALAHKHGGLAEGGFAMRPTFALFGEAGPEAVLPLRKDKLEKYGLLGGGGGRATILHNHFYVDGEKISESVVEHLPGAVRRKVGGTLGL